MNHIQEVETKRERVLDQLHEMQSLRRGTINEQFLKTKRKDGETVSHGPYYVFSRKEGKRTVSRRLKPGEELEQARKDIAEHKRFLGLCRELEVLTEELGKLTRLEQRSQEKKRRLPLNKTKS